MCEKKELEVKKVNLWMLLFGIILVLAEFDACLWIRLVLLHHHLWPIR